MYCLGLGLYGDEREFRANLVSFGRLASHTPHPGRVVALVALENLIFVWDMAGEPSEERAGICSFAACGRPRGLVKVVGDGTLLSVVLHAAECDWFSGTVPGQPYRPQQFRDRGWAIPCFISWREYPLPEDQ